MKKKLVIIENEFQKIIDKITSLIKKKKPDIQHLWDYFKKNKEGNVAKKEFFDKIEEIYEDVDQNELVALFENIDVNDNGYMT